MADVPTQANAPLPRAERSLAEAAGALTALRAMPAAVPFIDSAGQLLLNVTALGKKIMICGNGGSACDANHFAEELTGRFRLDRAPVAAMACTDVGHITCTANDFGYEHVFARWVTALGSSGDALIVLSTSGNSPSITRALQAARDRGMRTIALLGKTGGATSGMAEVEFLVPGNGSDRIQELHMLILHIWCEFFEPG